MNVQQQRQNATEEFYFLHPNHRIYQYRRSKKPFLFQVRTVPVLFIPGYQVPVYRYHLLVYLIHECIIIKFSTQKIINK